MPTPTLARIAALGAFVLGAALPAAAQRPGGAAAVDTAVFVQAQRLVSEGQGAQGRRLVDSVLAASPEGSPRYAEALFWRAVLAARAADAERDYRRVWVEYPLAPRAPDALVRLAQLELARGERDLAMRHLERLTRDYPGSPALPRASYWMARTLFETNDVARACDALATARATAPAGDVELRNQIDFHAKRCDSVGLAAAPASPPAPSRPAPSAAPSARQPAQQAARQPASRPATPPSADRPRPSAAAQPPASRPTPAANETPRETTRETPAVDTVPAPAERPTTATATPPRPRADTVAAPVVDTEPAAARRAPAEVDSTPSRPRAESTEPRAAPRAVGQYAVQVAAYDTETAARGLVTRLTARGLDAYLVSAQGIHRVRIGHYATRADALAALRDLRERKIEGFVVP